MLKVLRESGTGRDPVNFIRSSGKKCQIMA